MRWHLQTHKDQVAPKSWRFSALRYKRPAHRAWPVKTRCMRQSASKLLTTYFMPVSQCAFLLLVSCLAQTKKPWPHARPHAEACQAGQADGTDMPAGTPSMGSVEGGGEVIDGNPIRLNQQMLPRGARTIYP